MRAAASQVCAPPRRAACVLATLIALVARADAGPCAPWVALDGDPPAVAAVGEALGRLGIATDPPAPRCPGVHASVALEADGAIAVAILDRTHRSEGRVLTGASLAAQWIDSWLLDELDLPPVPAPRAALDGPGLRATAVIAGWSDRLAMSLGYEQRWDGAGSSWAGAAGGACVGVGPLCLGARVRYARQRRDDFGLPTVMDREDLSASATAGVALGNARAAMYPEVALGVGWLTTRRVDTDPCHVCDRLAVDSVTPRLSSALRISIRLVAPVWFEALGAVTFSPGAHTGAYLPGAGSQLPATDRMADLPGEPWASFALGVGLRVGAR